MDGNNSFETENFSLGDKTVAVIFNGSLILMLVGSIDLNGSRSKTIPLTLIRKIGKKTKSECLSTLRLDKMVNGFSHGILQ